MSTTIMNFVSYVNQAKGLAKPTRFRVEIGLQKLLASDLTQFTEFQVHDADRLAFFCDRAELPGRAFNASQVRNYGPFFKMPYQTQYQDMMLEFYVGQDLKEKKFFDAWFAAIEDPITRNFSYYNNYTTDIVISQLTEDSMEVVDSPYQITLINAWPAVMQTMNLDYSATDSFHKLQIVFNYLRWTTGNNPNVQSVLK